MSRRRRWFRYSLRTFFVLLTVFSACLGYLANWKRQRDEAMQWALREAGSSFDPRVCIGNGTGVWPPWHLWLLGDRNEFGEVRFDQRHAKHAGKFRELFPEIVVTVR